MGLVSIVIAFLLYKFLSFCILIQDNIYLDMSGLSIYLRTLLLMHIILDIQYMFRNKNNLIMLTQVAKLSLSIYMRQNNFSFDELLASLSTIQFVYFRS